MICYHSTFTPVSEPPPCGTHVQNCRTGVLVKRDRASQTFPKSKGGHLKSKKSGFRKGNSKQKQSSLERDGLPVMIGAVSGHGARVKSLVLFLFLAKNWPRVPGPGPRLKSLVLFPVLGQKLREEEKKKGRTEPPNYFHASRGENVLHCTTYCTCTVQKLPKEPV